MCIIVSSEMPSRKKAKGKARKAAKEAKAKEEDSEAVMKAVASQRQVQEEELEAHMQQLMVSAASPTKCWHGMLVPLSSGNKICLEFIDAFTAAFLSENKMGQAFFTAYHATKGEYSSVYSSKLDTVISMLLCRGTQRILEGNNKTAQLYASFACYFEDYMAYQLCKTKASPNLSKTFELLGTGADDHTLVSYYRKRIPCACLDQRYKEVKSVKKMGRCFNPSCSHHKRRVERSKMFSCTRCGAANYCSVECQRADWKTHKQLCDMAAEAKAAFDSEQL